jgi:hypothetical protein
MDKPEELDENKLLLDTNKGTSKAIDGEVGKNTTSVNSIVEIDSKGNQAINFSLD